MPSRTLGAYALYVVADLSHKIATRTGDTPVEEALLDHIELCLDTYKETRSPIDALAIVGGALALYRCRR